MRRTMPQVASAQILPISRRRIRSSTERGSMKERPTRSPLVGERKVIRSTSAGSCCMEPGKAARRPGKARIGRHIADPLAVDEQQAVVAQRLQQFLARANGHLSL